MHQGKEDEVPGFVTCIVHRNKFVEVIMEIRINTLTPELFLTIYQSVGWEPPCIEQVRTALENTIATFTA